MHTRHVLLTLMGIGSVLGLFPSCDMLGGLYDNDSGIIPPEEQYYDGSVKSGTFYVDATSYTQWLYVDLHGDSLAITTSTISLDDGSEDAIPAEWDFAMHRYDVKTNGGSVIQTSYDSIEQLEADMAEAPSEGWTADVYSDESVTIDMSHMLEGYLVYAPGYKNMVAGQWLKVDTSSMLPNYEMNDKVFLYKFADGTCAAIKLLNYMSTDRYQTKGWMTVKYKYPMFVKVKET